MAPLESSERQSFRPEQLEKFAKQEVEHNALMHGDASPYDDAALKTREGSDQLIRTYHNGDHEYLRVFENPKAAPETATNTGAYANLTHERGEYGLVERTRLNDILVPEQDRGRGTGRNLLSVAEANARDHGAHEIYGHLDGGQDVRAWYQHRGYAFRPDPIGGEEVYKVFS